MGRYVYLEDEEIEDIKLHFEGVEECYEELLNKLSQKPKTLGRLKYKPITKSKDYYVKECDRAKDKEFWISKRNDNRVEVVIPDECESFDVNELIAIATRMQELSNKES